MPEIPAVNPETISFKQPVYWHNLLYVSEHYDCTIEDPAIRRVGTIAESIMSGFAHSVIDVGCGTGALLNALRYRGYDVLGLEYSDASLRL